MASQPHPLDMSKNLKLFVVVALIEIISSLIPNTLASEDLISFLWGESFGAFKTTEISIIPMVTF